MRVTIALAGALLLGCGAEPVDGAEPVQGVELAVRGGSPAPDDSAVVGVVNFSGGQCSGSLLTPRLVLTARHCVADTAGEEVKVVCGETKFDPPDSSGAVFVVPQPTITEDPEDYRAVAKILLPEDASDDLCGSDEVLLVLKEPLIGPTPLSPRIDQPVTAGESYASVGFGVDDALSGKPSGERKRLEGLQVTCAGSGCAVSDVRDNEWIGSGGPCSGDSGGPALDSAGRVIGVVSRGKDHCAEPVFGDVSSRGAWLVEQALAAASAAGEQRPSWVPCSDAHPCQSDTQDDGLESSCSVSVPADSRSSGWVTAALGLGLFGITRARRGGRVAARRH